MNTLQEKFKNELGNTIHVSVEHKEIEAVPGIVISISGPTSLTENHVTLAEAQVIYDLLGKTLGTSAV